MQNISFNLPELLYTIIAGVISAGIWIWRKVSTNEKRVAVLETEIKNAAEKREIQNEHTAETLNELKSDMHELRNDVKSLLIQNKVGR